jgi:hypothetical protein
MGSRLGSRLGVQKGGVHVLSTPLEIDNKQLVAELKPCKVRSAHTLCAGLHSNQWQKS